MRQAAFIETAVAAVDRGMAGDGNLHEEKVVEPVGIDFDFSSILKPVDGGIALPQVIHARLQIGAAPVQTQQMRLQNARHACPHGVKIT